LREQLAALMAASSATRDEARKLTQALRGNTGRRGRWGEQTCRNVLEAAGMAGRFDFTEQTSSADDEGRQNRPDFIVRLPGGGMFVIDAKVPLAFEDDDGDEEARARSVGLRTAASLKTHVRQLSSKAYQDQFKPSPDFVVLFVPGDSFLATALDHAPDLLSDAMDGVPQARWQDDEQLHLTLRFIGEVDRPVAEDIAALYPTGRVECRIADTYGNIHDSLGDDRRSVDLLFAALAAEGIAPQPDPDARRHRRRGALQPRHPDAQLLHRRA
jgi:hypothetical protein